MRAFTALLALALLPALATAQTQTEVFRFGPGGPNAGDFGASVATDGTLAIIGDPGDSTFGFNAGAVHIYELQSVP